MKAIAVDDEIYMLETLQEAVNASSDIETSTGFSAAYASAAEQEENACAVSMSEDAFTASCRVSSI